MPPICFLSYSESDEPSGHRLYMDFMLHNATPRMLQLVIEDATERQKALAQTIRSTELVLVIVSAASTESALQQEQVEIALALSKPIRVVALDASPLPAWLTSHIPNPEVCLFTDQPWDDAVHDLLAAVGIPLQTLSTELPADEAWVPDKWRVKFYNNATRAHGYGELQLSPDHSVTGTLNIAQGKLTAQTSLTAAWKLEGQQLTIEGQQLVRPMRQPMSYLLSVTISEFGALTFRAQTAQADDSVFQRAPKQA